MVEVELKFKSLPNVIELFEILKKWFGLHHLITEQAVKAHRDCGRIPSYQGKECSSRQANIAKSLIA